MRNFLLSLLLSITLQSQTIPRWEDFRVRTDWSGHTVPLKLVRPDERMFHTQLSNGAKQRPNFAGHYRFVGWGCGSVCAAGALIDLQTGAVYPPPGSSDHEGWDRWIFSGGFVDGPFIESRTDSRLVITRQQSKDPSMQYLSYYEWSGTAFRLLTRRIEKKQEQPQSPHK